MNESNHKQLHIAKWMDRWMDGWMDGMERNGLEWIDRQMEMEWAYSLNMRLGCAAYFLKPLTYFRRTKMGGPCSG